VCRLVSFRSPVSVCLSVCVCNPVAGMSCFALRCFLYFLWVWLITTGSELRASSLARSSANLSLRYFTVCVLYLKHWMRNRLIDWLIDWLTSGDWWLCCSMPVLRSHWRVSIQRRSGQEPVECWHPWTDVWWWSLPQLSTQYGRCQLWDVSWWLLPAIRRRTRLAPCLPTYVPLPRDVSPLSLSHPPPAIYDLLSLLTKLRHDSILMTLKWPPRLSANHSRLADFMFRTDRNCWSCIIVLWRH